MKKVVFLIIVFFSIQVSAQEWGIRVAETVMRQWEKQPPGDPKKTWAYDIGVVLKGLEGLWIQTGDGRYFQEIQKRIDHYVQPDGSILNYKLEEYNIDHVNNGKLVLMLYQVTGKEKYKKAADLLRSQLRSHPRTREGGFWHKKIYPWQMWLDGLYMGAPFYAEYAKIFGEDTAFQDIANQFIWMEKHARDPQTGLLYHAWDESREQAWANKETGCSPLFWGRAMGWYADALVDALDHFPDQHPARSELIAILNRLVNAIEQEQDAKTGLWYDIIHYDGPEKEKNYLETSASSQFIYAIAKGVRKGYLPESKSAIALRAYDGLIKEYIREENGETNLYGTVKVSGLGGKPYRDGSFAYYMSEPVVMNDPKGVGAFLLASNEIENLRARGIGQGKTILLDRFFNSEQKNDAAGRAYFWHYTWEERSNAGFYTIGKLFEGLGARTASLDKTPTRKNLRQADLYILVDPDHQKDNPHPHYVNAKAIKSIKSWVKKGGVLWLMANDSANCELTSLNKLAASFGIQFTNTSLNMVRNNQFEEGAVITGYNPIFSSGLKLYLKEISTLQLREPARAIVRKQEHAIIGLTKFGKGWVFAVGDPWLYNEYVDGRKLPDEFSNHQAAREFIRWSLQSK